MTDSLDPNTRYFTLTLQNTTTRKEYIFYVYHEEKYNTEFRLPPGSYQVLGFSLTPFQEYEFLGYFAVYGPKPQHVTFVTTQPVTKYAFFNPRLFNYLIVTSQGPAAENSMVTIRRKQK
jgi:hypothetical protein